MIMPNPKPQVAVGLLQKAGKKLSQAVIFAIDSMKTRNFFVLVLILFLCQKLSMICHAHLKIVVGCLGAYHHTFEDNRRQVQVMHHSLAVEAFKLSRYGLGPAPSFASASWLAHWRTASGRAHRLGARYLMWFVLLLVWSWPRKGLHVWIICWSRAMLMFLIRHRSCFPNHLRVLVRMKHTGCRFAMVFSFVDLCVVLVADTCTSAAAFAQWKQRP